MIIEILELAAALEWIALGVLGFFELRSQKRRLEEAIKEYDSFVMGKTYKLEINKESYRSLIGEAEKDENGKYKPDTYKIGKIRVRFLAPSTHHTMGGLKVDEKTVLKLL